MAQSSAPSQHQRQYRQQSPNGSRYSDGLITITAYHWAMASMPTIANAQRPTTANHANTAYHWGNGTAWRG
ncbi:hypothetical protein NKT77_09980 [Moraxella sp. FZLJ2107]|uniref:hypothetical protein n=1 Tax=unclassified Moraxella TaxID=2685852 RepID=UPI0020C843CA|nr:MULTISPECIES: hypothetical protein [unclassified Moraxella]UTO04804.1 hypothetical protein NKT77_09920 [Moraxella sp. FZLJ2107]UTO04816.1 hypothetical protein NKT77_09980 [Moraxella sp. FZLJ2107]UTO21549.1 hypothetical protein NKU06_06790 [Moraxella sp. FZLJ2109]